MMQALFRFFLCLVVHLPLIMLSAWALEKIWNWYIPFIFQIQEITFASAVGINLIVSFITLRVEIEKTKTEKEEWVELATKISLRSLYPLVAVGLAWIYLQIWPVVGI